MADRKLSPRQEAAIAAGQALKDLLPDEDLRAGDVPDLEGIVGIIFGPIKPLVPDAQAFLDKKLGESTGAEFLAFAVCVAYGLAVGYFGAQVAVGILRAGAPRVSGIRVPIALR